MKTPRRRITAEESGQLAGYLLATGIKHERRRYAWRFALLWLAWIALAAYVVLR